MESKPPDRKVQGLIHCHHYRLVIMDLMTNVSNHSQRQVENGVEDQPDRLEIFKLTHCNKGKTNEYVDAASTKAVQDLEKAEEERRKLNGDITPEVREYIYASNGSSFAALLICRGPELRCSLSSAMPPLKTGVKVYV
ncbi:hypothetical protein ACLB2K_021713 [Fragaria x ananassa]